MISCDVQMSSSAASSNGSLTAGLANLSISSSGSVAAGVTNLTMPDAKSAPAKVQKAGFILFIGRRRVGTSTQAARLRTAIPGSVLFDHKEMNADRNLTIVSIKQQIALGHLVILDTFSSILADEHKFLESQPGLVVCLYEDENSVAKLRSEVLPHPSTEFVSRHGTVQEVHDRVLKVLNKHGF